MRPCRATGFSRLRALRLWRGGLTDAEVAHLRRARPGLEHLELT